MTSTRALRALALATAAFMGTVAIAEAAVDSTVTLRIENARFKGKVKASVDECVVGRKVLLIRKEANGDRTRVAKTFAAEDGRYKVVIPQQSGNRFFAKVKSYETPGGTLCRGDRSPVRVAE